jgi:hypothetical protein
MRIGEIDMDVREFPEAGLDAITESVAATVRDS